MHELRWANEDLFALPERALWWPRRRTLLVADLHLGKPAAFRASGVPVPESATVADLARLSGLLGRLPVARLVVLGDLLHARSGREQATMAAFASFRERHAALEFLLIRGNHDLHAGDPPADWRVRVVPEPHHECVDGEIALAHDPAAAGPDPTLCGHVHPAVTLVGPASSLRVPCFRFGRRVGVLPAFGSFTGSRSVRPAPGEIVLAVGPGEVVDVSVHESVHLST